MLSIFSYASWPSVCLLWGKVYLGLLSSFWVDDFLILSYLSYLNILEINPLLVASFANIFSHSADCLFVLFMISFTVKKAYKFNWSHFFLLLSRFLQFQLLFLLHRILISYSNTYTYRELCMGPNHVYEIIIWRFYDGLEEDFNKKSEEFWPQVSHLVSLLTLSFLVYKTGTYRKTQSKWAKNCWEKHTG